MRKPHPPPRWLLRYGVAIVAVGLALLVRMAIDPYLHDHLPYVTFFVAVTVAAWFGGLGPALLSTALGFLAAAYFFIAPRGAFWITNTGDAIGVVSYFVVTLAIALFSHAMHKAREQALLRQHELEREVGVRRQAGREREIASEFLALVNAATGMRQLVESAAHFFKAQADCEAVDIRLREGDGDPCCEAHGMGYESVALIALRVGEDRLGLLQLSDRRKSRFTPDMMALWEKLAGYLAVALAKMRAEEALRQSESRYRRLMQAIPVPLGVVNRNGQSIYFNDRFTQVFGYTLADLPTLDAWWQKAYPEEAYRRRVIENWQAKMHRSEQTGTETEPEELPVICKDGSARVVVITNLVIDDCILAAFVDVTERKRAEEALHQFNAQLEQRVEQRTVDVEKERRRLFDVLETLPAMICLLTPDYHIAFANRSFRDRFGESSGRRCYEHCFGFDKPCEFCESYSVLKTGQPHHWEVHTPDGKAVIAAHDYPFTDVDGSPLILEMDLDITEQRQTEAALHELNATLEQRVEERTVSLRQSEERQRLVAEEMRKLNRTLRALSSSSQAMLRATDEKQYVQEVCQIIVKDCGHRMAWVGYALEDEGRTVEPVAWAGVEEGYVRIAGITWADTQRGRGPTGTAIRTREVVVCNDFVSDPRFAPWRSEALKRGYASSISLPLLAEGRAFGALMIYSELPAPFSADEVALLTELAGNLAHGITTFRMRHARAQAETALRESEQRFRGIVETAEEGIATHQPDGTITYVNQRMADMLGYSRDQIIGKSSFDFVEDDEKEAIIRARQGLKEQGSFSTERRLRRKDGSDLWTLVNVSPRCDDAGNLLGYLAMHTDITARKRTEEELNIARLNAEHARAIAEEANGAKDHFLAVLSHELRTPLNPALMAATILDGNPQLPPDLREDVAIIRRNVELEARLIDDMLDLTRIARGKLTLNRRIVDGREVLQHAIQTCDADAMNRYLALELTIPDEPLWVDADPARLQQVFWNLLKNAIKFTPEHGRITVIAAASARGGLHVEVRDTGKGIAPEALTSIFDAFEQGGSNVTRRYGGLGLGLAICKGLVAMHDGSIHAASEGPGKGATFVVELPPAQHQGPSQQPATHAGEAASSTDGGYRILLVEDHESTAAMTTRLLRSFGHRVSTADSIKGALAKFADEPFDLIISDLGLPDGTGHDLIRKVLAQRPVPAIALSGYGMDGDIQQSAEAGFLEHLVKPINIRQLEAAIARVTQHKSAWKPR